MLPGGCVLAKDVYITSYAVVLGDTLWIPMIAAGTHPALRSTARFRIPRRCRVLSVLCLLVLIDPLCALCQPHVPGAAFRRITTDDGLSQSVILCMVQDRQGFMWFGTEDGLNRFDGYSFVTYRYDPLDSNSLSSSYIWSLHVDRDGMLWIGTWGGGLNSFDPVRNRFTRYQYDPADTTSISHDRVTGLTEDSLGSLWACTAGGGVSRFDRSQRRIVRMPDLFSTLPPPRRSAIFCIMTASDGVIWMGTYAAGLLSYDPRTGAVKEYRHKPEEKSSISDDRITGLRECGNGDLWVGTWGGGLNLLSRSSDTFEHFRADPRDPSSLPGDIVRSLLLDSRGDLWVGTMGAGLARFDSSTRRFTSYRFSPFIANSLSDDVVTSLLEDAGGVLWFGTSNGVSVSSSSVQKFPLYAPDTRNPDGLHGKRVFAMCQDSLGFVWIGTEDSGLNRFDPRSGTFRHYRHDPRNPGSLPHDYVSALLTDDQGDVWAGTYGGGLARFDRAGDRFRRFTVDPDNPARRLNQYISTIAQDHSGNLWVGTWMAGLYCMTRAGKIVGTFANDKANPRSLPDNDIRCLLVGRSGALWVGTARGALSRYDPATSSFQRFEARPEDPRSLSNAYVQAITDDGSGNLWIGTFGGGLNKLDLRTGECRRFMTQDGLPNDVVYAILPDRSGKYWLSTNRGISCFDPGNSTFRNFTRFDGLQADEFNYSAACSGADGTLYFGGVNGFNAILPGRIPRNPHIPPIVVTGFNVFDKPVRLENAPFATTEITLGHDDNFFSLEYAALDYALPARNTYAYMLEGVDRTWVEAGTRRLAGYTDLAPGDYVFHVKGANNDGVWNEAGASLHITITPPFWKTPWFRILGVLVLLGALTAAYQLRVASLLKVERMRLSIASDLHDDIGSSLASIAVLADLVRNRTAVPAVAAEHLLDISRAARSTSDALRDIVWFVNPEHDTTANIIDRLQDIAAKMLAGMEHTFQRDDRDGSAHLPMTFRRDILLIYKEVLANIVRHADAKHVEIHASIHSGRFLLTVTDDGRGFDSSAPLPGNGLASMQRRARQWGGTLEIAGAPGKGTIVKLNAKIP
jgi:ligand-binding sensor domain-containing protein/signal transduction histidine kinase